VHIGRLRKALNVRNKKDPIRTIRAVGYSIEKVS
jgi:DNA-binding response OmpR family regulator